MCFFLSLQIYIQYLLDVSLHFVPFSAKEKNEKSTLTTTTQEKEWERSNLFAAKQLKMKCKHQSAQNEKDEMMFECSNC